ncbi:uncharacterized protein I206_101376 [Kwoniella pini CBS 10737]|uniref:Uncharacterized protein n=1 Tax=Kwoniella pini CBS 10737 TaxID=1296096 RepID=A0A1B9HWW1_9TREE|nr:uncharacterized protein I206_06654 [Kwoniella pini CBS 10737]OCF47748.1 hypothetical protein I206_06654 [Kwoniella pini CBS 10737]
MTRAKSTNNENISRKKRSKNKKDNEIRINSKQLLEKSDNEFQKKNKVSDEKTIPTSSEFIKDESKISIPVKIGEDIKFEVHKKLMSTGSFGWSGNRNSKITLGDGKNVNVSISVNIVVQNSSSQKKDSLAKEY